MTSRRNFRKGRERSDRKRYGHRRKHQASIGDRVFLDSNGNGIQDKGEQGIKGSVVKLLDRDGHVVATDVTDAHGRYKFSRLAAGDYRVMFVQPEGFVPSPVDQGLNDKVDSDADPANGLVTDVITLGCRERNRTVDAGFVKAAGTLTIENFEFVFQDPDAPDLADKILTERPFARDPNSELVDTALLIPDLGESFTQLLTLTADGGDVKDGTLDLTITNPFVDVTSVTIQGGSADLIASQTDDGEQQVTTITLPDTLAQGDEIVLEVVSTVTNAITDTDASTPVDAITDKPLQEYNFEFELVDNPGIEADLGAATFEGKIYASERFFDTSSGSSEYELLEIDDYVIEATIGETSSSLEAEVFTAAGNLIEGIGGVDPGFLHTLYFLDLAGGVNPRKRRRSITNAYYSDPTFVEEFLLVWDRIPSTDISDFIEASGQDGFQLWVDLVEQGIFSRNFFSTTDEDGSGSEFSTDTFTQQAISGNLLPASLNSFTLDFEQDLAGNELLTGQILDDELAPLVTISSDSLSQPTIIFDSSRPTGGDRDLGTPNTDFGGPGQGSGGSAGTPGENADALNSVLIIAENTIDADGDGLVDIPDDNQSGGTINFDFVSPVRVQFLTVVDIDRAEFFRVEAYDAEGTLVKAVDATSLGGNSVEILTIDAEDVAQLKVVSDGSFAIDDLILGIPDNLQFDEIPAVLDAPETHLSDGVAFAESDTSDVDLAKDLTVGLFDRETDTLIRKVSSGDVMDIGSGHNPTLGIKVAPGSALFDQVEGVLLDLNKGAVMAIDNVEPYTLFGDRQDSSTGSDISWEDNSIALTLFPKDNGNGELIGT
ncbi:MAG: SdrD B-like domain-containing protein [Leptolyngbyaceae cyanobacterium]